MLFITDKICRHGFPVVNLFATKHVNMRGPGNFLRSPNTYIDVGAKIFHGDRIRIYACKQINFIHPKYVHMRSENKSDRVPNT